MEKETKEELERLEIKYRNFSNELNDLLDKYDLNFACELETHKLEIEIYLSTEEGFDLLNEVPEENEEEKEWNETLKNSFEVLLDN